MAVVVMVAMVAAAVVDAVAEAVEQDQNIFLLKRRGKRILWMKYGYKCALFCSFILAYFHTRRTFK
jgi:hypothetical protein